MNETITRGFADELTKISGLAQKLTAAKMKMPKIPKMPKMKTPRLPKPITTPNPAKDALKGTGT